MGNTVLALAMLAMSTVTKPEIIRDRSYRLLYVNLPGCGVELSHDYCDSLYRQSSMLTPPYDLGEWAAAIIQEDGSWKVGHWAGCLAAPYNGFTCSGPVFEYKP